MSFNVWCISLSNTFKKNEEWKSSSFQLVSVWLSHQVAIANFPVVPLELQQSSRPELCRTWPLQRGPADRLRTPRRCPGRSTAPCKGRSPHATQDGQHQQRTCWRDARRSPLFRSTCVLARHPLETNWCRLVTGDQDSSHSSDRGHGDTLPGSVPAELRFIRCDLNLQSDTLPGLRGEKWTNSFIHSLISAWLAALSRVNRKKSI